MFNKVVAVVAVVCVVSFLIRYYRRLLSIKERHHRPEEGLQFTSIYLRAFVDSGGGGGGALIPIDAAARESISSVRTCPADLP
jgi:hypothetical protein